MIRAAAWVVVILGSVLPARGFVSYVNPAGRVLRWNLAAPSNFVHTNVVNRTTKAVRYFLASDAFSASHRADELNAARACFGQWQSIPGTVLKFEEGGWAGANADLNSADNTNVVFWAKRSTLVNGGFDDIHGLIGYTVTTFANDNTLLDADIVLNGVDYGWFTDFDDPERADVFVESVLLHEIGHFIGLDHSPVGGATVTFGGFGLDTEAGLSSDEVSAVRALYPQAALPATLGDLRGQVRMNGAGVFGAVVTAENAAGNVAAGTVAQSSGAYELPALPSGDYQIRVTPLDPSSAPETSSLRRGGDIAAEYESAVTAFLPSTNRPVTLKPGVTNTLDFTVLSGTPAFRIAAISRPSLLFGADTADRYAAEIGLGWKNYFVGVSSTTLPTNQATLRITGDGLTVGFPIFKPNRFFDGSNLILIPVSVAPNATPGLRTLIVEQGANIAYANGFLEVATAWPDFNFDGLDDRWQRRYFPIFTGPAAGPAADPDGDGFSNRFEFETGTDPTDPRSFAFRVVGIVPGRTGTSVTWLSEAGTRFQLWSRAALVTGEWQSVGSVVVGQSPTTTVMDASGTNGSRFYRVQILP